MRQQDGRLARPMLGAMGELDHGRRLGDKILSAFNHAYAIGEIEIARSLRQALVDSEAAARERGRERRGGGLLRHADLWVGFVEARNAYNRAVTSEDISPETLREALQAMQEAYQRWSRGAPVAPVALTGPDPGG